MSLVSAVVVLLCGVGGPDNVGFTMVPAAGSCGTPGMSADRVRSGRHAMTGTWPFRSFLSVDHSLRTNRNR